MASITIKKIAQCEASWDSKYDVLRLVVRNQVKWNKYNFEVLVKKGSIVDRKTKYVELHLNDKYSAIVYLRSCCW